MHKDIGLGVIGLGLGAMLLKINQDDSSRIKVRGIYDPDPLRKVDRYETGKSVQRLADENDVDFVAEDHRQLIDSKDIDCIAVYSPNSFHLEHLTAAIEAGKHIVVTKPMVCSLQEARTVVSMVEKAGTKFLVAQSFRWNGMMRAIHERYADGELGDVNLAEAYYMHDMRPVLDKAAWRYEEPLDWLYGGVCHPVDLLRWFLGEVDEVFAYGNRSGIEKRYPAGRNMNFVISLKYASGAIGRVLGAFDIVHPPNLWHCDFHGVGIGLYGTKASVINDRIVRDYYQPGCADEEIGGPKEEKIEPEFEAILHVDELMRCLHDFEDCIVNDNKPILGVRDAAQVVAVSAACEESIRTGQPAKVTREFD